MDGLAWIARLRGDYDAAIPYLEESQRLWDAAGDRGGVALSLDSLGRVARLRGDYTAARGFLEASLAIRREIGDRGSIAETTKALAWVARGQKDHAEARSLAREALTIFRQQDDKQEIAESLELLAACAAAQNQPDRAARLFGSAEALRETIGAPLPPASRPDYEQGVAATRSALDVQAFAAAWAEGQAMTREQAVAYALTENQP